MVRRCATKALLLITLAPAMAKGQMPLNCEAAAQGNGPLFHVTSNCSKGADGSVKCGGGNDANAVFLSRGVWHIMNQRGAGSGWNHATSTDGAHWKHRPDAINLHSAGYRLGGACDGTLSFPDLGRQPYNGSIPIILYGPSCNSNFSSIQGRGSLGAGVGDYPHFTAAFPANPTDPFFVDQFTPNTAMVTFNSTMRCSFPGRVWKSAKGEYWNMVCVPNNGPAPHTENGVNYARYTTTDSTLMSGWTLADLNFVRGLPPGGHPCSGTQWSKKYNTSDLRHWECAGNANLHRIPGTAAGATVTHILSDNTLGKFWLGVYDPATEAFTISRDFPQPVQVLSPEGGTFWALGSQGPDPASETSRLFAVGWGPGHDTLLFELGWDPHSDGLVVRPTPELQLLRNATLVANASVLVPPHAPVTVPVDPNPNPNPNPKP